MTMSVKIKDGDQFNHMDANFVEKALESNEFAKQMIQKARELLGGTESGQLYFTSDISCSIGSGNTYQLTAANKQKFQAMAYADITIYIFSA